LVQVELEAFIPIEALAGTASRTFQTTPPSSSKRWGWQGSVGYRRQRPQSLDAHRDKPALAPIDVAIATRAHACGADTSSAYGNARTRCAAVTAPLAATCPRRPDSSTIMSGSSRARNGQLVLSDPLASLRLRAAAGKWIARNALFRGFTRGASIVIDVVDRIKSSSPPVWR
jgi:hypothetical protein